MKFVTTASAMRSEKRSIYAVWAVLFFLPLGEVFAVPTPTLPLKKLRKIVLQVDMRSLVGPKNIGNVPESKLKEKINDVNRIWGQCSISFHARLISNVSAAKLGVRFEPQSQSDYPQHV